MSEDRLGLSDEEVDWLKTNKASPSARTLISLYNMVVDYPADHGARTLFKCTLEDWQERAINELFGEK